MLLLLVVLLPVVLVLLMVLVEREFLVLERDHLVPGRGGRPRRPGESGRGRAQRRGRQRRRYLLQFYGRAQVVRADAARYKVLGHHAAAAAGAASIVGRRQPAVAHHGLLHGTPAQRLSLERRRRCGQRYAVPAAAVVAPVATFVVVHVFGAPVVERGRRQNRRFLAR